MLTGDLHRAFGSYGQNERRLRPTIAPGGVLRARLIRNIPAAVRVAALVELTATRTRPRSGAGRGPGEVPSVTPMVAAMIALTLVALAAYAATRRRGTVTP